MDFATGDAAEPRQIVTRVLFMNFASIHTTLMVFYRISRLTEDVHTCIVLPSYVSRVCGAASKGGGRCSQRERMDKAGSHEDAQIRFLPKRVVAVESIRLQYIPNLRANSEVAITRLVVGDGITFSNGVFVGPGEVIATPVYAAHTDESVYPSAKEFDGFRFSRMREQEGESAKHHASNVSADYLTFGQGRHAWYLHMYGYANKARDGFSRSMRSS